MTDFSKAEFLKTKGHGFTLIEMAIVLVIVGLLLTGIITPLSAQIDARNYSETRKQLTEIKETLLGYSLSHLAADGKPYLPCPDINGDGLEDRAGAICTSLVGSLPTQDLGITALDSWNNAFIYRVSPNFSNKNTGFTLTSTGNITVLNSSGGSNLVNNIPALILSMGKNGAAVSVNPDEIENTDADAIYVSHEFMPIFDDIVVWVSPNILFNRAVEAGLLP